MKKIINVLLYLFVTVFATQSFASDDWKHGIGTGFFALNLEGDVGMHTNLLGPVQVSFDLDTSEISDVLLTAFGIGGFSTSGKWKVLYSLQYMELPAEIKGYKADAVPVACCTTYSD